MAKQQFTAVRDASESMRECAVEAQERAHDLESQLVDERKSTQSYAEARAKEAADMAAVQDELLSTIRERSDNLARVQSEKDAIDASLRERGAEAVAAKTEAERCRVEAAVATCRAREAETMLETTLAEVQERSRLVTTE